MLIDYLNYHEFLAVGVGMDTYDDETVRRLAAGRIMRIAEGYTAYVEWARATQDRPLLYTELEHLAQRLRTDAATPPR
ncbi:MAG TPA: DUF4760 domain-containing protein [Humibacillus xanthopallidus]|nr:DUF4760 domain-containing protein [Humibacillus xanthopallidus]